MKEDNIKTRQSHDRFSSEAILNKDTIIQRYIQLYKDIKIIQVYIQFNKGIYNHTKISKMVHTMMDEAVSIRSEQSHTY